MTVARGRDGQLTAEAILAAALGLTKQVGVEQLTMRALAEQLGVSPMATYYYVENRDALLLLVADEIMKPVEPPPESAGTWDERLWEYMHTMSDALAAYPGLSDFLLHHDPTAETRRYMRTCIEVVAQGGFDAEQAKQAFAAIYTYMWGHSIFLAMQHRRASRPGSGRRRRGGDLPSVDELASPEQTELGYRALVAGLESTLRPARRARKNGARR